MTLGTKDKEDSEKLRVVVVHRMVLNKAPVVVTFTRPGSFLVHFGTSRENQTESHWRRGGSEMLLSVGTLCIQTSPGGRNGEMKRRRILKSMAPFKDRTSFCSAGLLALCTCTIDAGGGGQV